ncbi:MAG: type II secretion system protein [Minisyncoccia bacterium]
MSYSNKNARPNLVRGFSLIELLVVIAIIGMLSAVVLASLNSARSKSANASIKSSLANARAQAELFYDTNGTLGYLGACGSANSSGGEESIQKFVIAANSVSRASGTTPNYTQSFAQPDTSISVCHASAGGWAASVPLKISETVGASTYEYFCVDHTGKSLNRISPLAGNAIICPAT